MLPPHQPHPGDENVVTALHLGEKWASPASDSGERGSSARAQSQLTSHPVLPVGKSSSTAENSGAVAIEPNGSHPVAPRGDSRRTVWRRGK